MNTIGFAPEPKPVEVKPPARLTDPTANLKLFQPKEGEIASYCYPNGSHVFTGRVTKIVKRPNDSTLYRMEDAKGNYDWGYAEGMVRPEDVPPKKTKTREELAAEPCEYHSTYVGR